MRNVKFITGEYYHVFNRGVDKRAIFMDREDVNRFFRSMIVFNTLRPVGSIFEQSFRSVDKRDIAGDYLGSLAPKKERLVDFFCYCLNENHFHFGLKQTAEKGIEKFMQRLGTGYTNYFNEKLNRTGSLFQGPYKAVRIISNTQLLHVSAYINFNHRLNKRVWPYGRSSWEEYKNISPGICEKTVILTQFRGTGYQKFALSSLEDIRKRKSDLKNSESQVWELSSQNSSQRGVMHRSD